MLSTALALDSKELRDRIMRTKNFAQSLDLLADITADFGFTQVLYGYIPTTARLPNGDWLPLKLNTRRFPSGWEAGWEPFMRIDPYYRACFESTFPIEWADVQRRETLTSSQRTACAYLGDIGLSRGITVPVHLPFGRFAVMSAIADRSCRNWHSVREQAAEPLFRLMHVFTKTIHDLGYEGQIEVVRPVRLTPREQECLRWASAGKTSSETAIILSRSVETVRLHIKNSIAKLNATNRSQAVGTAMQLGLI